MKTGSPARGAAAEILGDRAPAEVFIWPPRPALLDPTDREEPAPGHASPGHSRAPQAGRSLHLVEAAWLGLAALSWKAAAARASWAVDEPGAYCPRCASSVGPFEADADGCSTCRGRRLVWSRAVRLGTYEGVLRDAILAGKYTAWRRVCQDLGSDLGREVARALGEAGVPAGRVTVCPVPTSRRRRLARGVDHTVVMAREVARVTGGVLVKGLVRDHRPPQQGLSAEARRKNVAGAFRPRARACAGLDGQVVVLVDDVRTTGATMTAAGRALREGIRNAGGREQAVWTAVAAVAGRG